MISLCKQYLATKKGNSIRSDIQVLPLDWQSGFSNCERRPIRQIILRYQISDWIPWRRLASLWYRACTTQLWSPDAQAMVDDPPPAADTISKQRTPQCRPSCKDGAINWNSIDRRCSCVVQRCDGIPIVCALVHRAKKVLRCELRSPLCTLHSLKSPARPLHQKELWAGLQVASCKLGVGSWELQVICAPRMCTVLMASLFVQTTICTVSARLAWWQQKQSIYGY